MPNLLHARPLQVWIFADVDYEVDDKWTIEFEQVGRWKRGFSELFQWYSQLQVFKDLPCDWRIGPAFRIQRKSESSGWESNHVPYIDLIKSINLPKLKCSNRNRIEYEITSKAWTYRNKTKIGYPFNCCTGEWMPFISEELFFGSFRKYDENRWEVGVGFPLPKNMEAAISFMQRYKLSSGAWEAYDILNIKIALDF